MGAVGEVSSRAVQAQVPASALAAARTITCRHASSSSTNAMDATKRVISSPCAAAVRFLDAQMSGEEEDKEETLGIFHTSTPVKASKEPWSTTIVIDQVPV